MLQLNYLKYLLITKKKMKTFANNVASMVVKKNAKKKQKMIKTQKKKLKMRDKNS